jgi:hypothetical protein
MIDERRDFIILHTTNYFPLNDDAVVRSAEQTHIITHMLPHYNASIAKELTIEE